MLALSTPDTLFTVTGVGPVFELIRRSSGLSTSSIARSASVENSIVKRIESGSGSLKSITRVARVLNTDVSVIATSTIGTEKLHLSELGDFIRRTRESQNISKNKLANRLKRTSVFIKGVEASVNPSMAAIDLVAKSLRITTELTFVVNGEEFVPPVAPRAETVKHVFTDQERWENLGEIFKKTRTDSNLSKLAVAYHAGVSLGTIDKIEAGRSSLASIDSYATATNHKLVVMFIDSNGRLAELAEASKLPTILNSIRETKRIPMSEMARRMNSSAASVQAFANNKSTPQLNTIVRYAEALGLTLGFRLSDSESITSQAS